MRAQTSELAEAFRGGHFDCQCVCLNTTLRSVEDGVKILLHTGGIQYGFER